VSGEEEVRQGLEQLKAVIKTLPRIDQAKLEAARSAILSVMYAHGQHGIMALSLIGGQIAAEEIKP
jgi:hypothetical protein